MQTQRIKDFSMAVLGTLWRHKGETVKLPVRSLGKLLMIFPRNPDEMKRLTYWRERILFLLHPAQIVVLSIGTPLEIAAEWSSEQLFFTDSDINMFGLISGHVIDAVKKWKFKSSIDLSPDFDFITAQIPLRAGIPTRFGISAHGKEKIVEKYFNIIFYRDEKLDYENVMNLFAQIGNT